MPGTITRPSPQEAAVRLAALALSIAGSTCALGPEAISVEVAHCSPLAGEPLAAAWDAYVYAIIDEHFIRQGLVMWDAIDETLTCQDRTTAAIDIASERSNAALAVLCGRDGGQSL